MIVSDATTELMKKFYNGKMPSFSGRSIVVLDGDKPVAIAGLMKKQDKIIMYSDITDDLRYSTELKRAMIKGYKRLLEWLPRCHVYAIADPEIKGSDVLLKHIGFEHIDGVVWRI